MDVTPTVRGKVHVLNLSDDLKVGRDVALEIYLVVHSCGQTVVTNAFASTPAESDGRFLSIKTGLALAFILH